MLYWTSIAVALVLGVGVAAIVGRYFPGREFAAYLIEGCVLALYGVLGRLFWKTGLSRPRLYDPYSAFNLSDSAKKLRGRSYRQNA